MIYLLDTDCCIAVLRGARTAVERLQSLSPDDCSVSSITAYEVFTGAEKARLAAREHVRLQRLFQVVEVLNFDAAAAAEAAKIRAALERAGTPIGPYDILIAGHALALHLTLATGNDAEFKRIPTLRVENWI